MPTTYAYKVRDREGKMVAGSLEAESEAAVVGRLRQMGYVPISIEAEKGAGLKTEIKLPGIGRVKLKDLAVFSPPVRHDDQLRAVAAAGAEHPRRADRATRRLAEVIVEVRADVEKGASLSAALAKHPKVFNRLYVSMVRAGEIGGFLDAVLLQIAETLSRSRSSCAARSSRR